jgi:hypothetical protein
MRTHISIVFCIHHRDCSRKFSIAPHALSATQTGFRSSVDGTAESDADAEARCAVPADLPPQLFPAGYSGKPGDALRPLAVVGVVLLKPIELHCPWPAANTGFRLTVVIVSLLGSAFFGVTLASGTNRTPLFKWFLCAVTVLMVIACAIDSRSVNNVASRLIPNGSYIDVEFALPGRFIGVCALDVFCALQAV